MVTSVLEKNCGNLHQTHWRGPSSGENRHRLSFLETPPPESLSLSSKLSQNQEAWCYGLECVAQKVIFKSQLQNLYVTSFGDGVFAVVIKLRSS